MPGSSPLYAAIDLGSNSFHMLVVRNVSGAVRAVSRVKRKVKLAQGLDENNLLSEEAIQRGLDCIRLFAEQLKDIPDQNIRIVATATLRLAKNSSDFIQRAEKILEHGIEIISGEEEARTIYHGVVSTSSASGNILVIDIGGASTELIIGEGLNVKVLHSTQMGCVTWLNNFFANDEITEAEYDKAIEASIEILSPLADEYLREGFSTCVGASGTIQSLQEIMISNGESEVVTLEKLLHLKEMTIEAGCFSKLNIAGLSAERLTVFPSGLAILIAIFRILDIKGMTLAGGALREGVIYRMLGDYAPRNIRTRTVDSLITRYQLDREQAERVTKVALNAFDSLKESWGLKDPSSRPVLKWAAMLYEIGLCIEYKKAPKHASYIIDNIEMPGFTNAQKHLLSALLFNERDAFKLDVLKNQSAVPYEEACALARLLRLAIIICVRRSPEAIDGEIKFEMTEHGKLELVTTSNWMDNHYLRATLLKEECQKQQEQGWLMSIREC